MCTNEKRYSNSKSKPIMKHQVIYTHKLSYWSRISCTNIQHRHVLRIKAILFFFIIPLTKQPRLNILWSCSASNLLTDFFFLLLHLIHNSQHEQNKHNLLRMSNMLSANQTIRQFFVLSTMWRDWAIVWQCGFWCQLRVLRWRSKKRSRGVVPYQRPMLSQTCFHLHDRATVHLVPGQVNFWHLSRLEALSGHNAHQPPGAILPL